MNATTPLVNAWIFLNEDEPKGTTYDSPNSSYQMLIKNNVYQSVDILYLCFVTTLPTSPDTIPTGDGSSYTIAMGAPAHNQPYMDNILRDARQNNPNIKIGVTLEFGDGNALSNIFSNANFSDQENAENFASNLMLYLGSFGLDGFDLDWESPISDDTTQNQFALLIDAIGQRFQNPRVKRSFLTLSPAEVGNLDPTAVNNNVDFLNLQLYSGFTNPSDFENAGVNADKFAYGAKFESGFQTAQQAFDDNQTNFQYPIFTNWRLNSNNFEFEQTQQQLLYKLVFPNKIGVSKY